MAGPIAHTRAQCRHWCHKHTPPHHMVVVVVIWQQQSNKAPILVLLPNSFSMVAAVRASSTGGTFHFGALQSAPLEAPWELGQLARPPRAPMGWGPERRFRGTCTSRFFTKSCLAGPSEWQSVYEAQHLPSIRNVWLRKGSGGRLAISHELSSSKRQLAELPAIAQPGSSFSLCSFSPLFISETAGRRKSHQPGGLRRTEASTKPASLRQPRYLCGRPGKLRQETDAPDRDLKAGHPARHRWAKREAGGSRLEAARVAGGK